MPGSILAEKLEDVWRECRDSEQLFPHKRILHIGSESFDAQTVTVVQGLAALGFEVCTIGKANINSWFCNKIIANPAKFKFDFILSALHWGTRFSHFRRFGLLNYPKVLIDGDDSIMVNDAWRTKYDRYVERYDHNLPNEVKDAESPPHRWTDTLDGYEPDVVFTLAAERRQGNHYYIPKGIRDQWRAMGLNKDTQSRTIDFAHIPGSGTWREAMRDLLDLGVLPGNVYNARARGEPVYPNEIRTLAEKDSVNTHSYYRWACYPEFYQVLNNAKVFVHPGIDHWPFWEAARIYEAWACGCLVAMSEPTVDVSNYPPTGVCPDAVFASHDELIDKARFWHASPKHLDTLRKRSARRAYKYFSPASVARYFLRRVHDAILL